MARSWTETALHFGNRNINTDGARGVWYNDTGARLIARTLTNFVGNQGPGVPVQLAVLPLLPGAAGLGYVQGGVHEGARHGRQGLRPPWRQGDTCIGRAVVTDKYHQRPGRALLRDDAVGEDLEGNIVQGCPSEIVLPSKDGI